MVEAYRLYLMRGIEEQLASSGYGLVAGVDEAGRGALAGPVVAAAVIMDPRQVIPGIDDSKALSPRAREALAGLIEQHAISYAVAASSAEEIDSGDILSATRRAMIRALAALSPAPECVLVDAVALPGQSVPVLALIRGDVVSYSVACASVLAKVDRDRRMVAYHASFPHYGFDGHKGYGAPAHRASLRTYGPSPIHRLTFGSVVPRLEQVGACKQVGACEQVGA